MEYLPVLVLHLERFVTQSDEEYHQDSVQSHLDISFQERPKSHTLGSCRVIA